MLLAAVSPASGKSGHAGGGGHTGSGCPNIDPRLPPFAPVSLSAQIKRRPMRGMAGRALTGRRRPHRRLPGPFPACVVAGDPPSLLASRPLCPTPLSLSLLLVVAVGVRGGLAGATTAERRPTAGPLFPIVERSRGSKEPPPVMLPSFLFFENQGGFGPLDRFIFFLKFFFPFLLFWIIIASHR